MRVLCDESVPRSVEERLVENGHDVSAIRTLAPGAPDDAVLERAVTDQRVLITYDRDFGTLLFRDRLAAPPAVLLLRDMLPDAEQEAERVRLVLAHVKNGFLYVISRGEIRERRMKSA